MVHITWLEFDGLVAESYTLYMTTFTCLSSSPHRC